MRLLAKSVICILAVAMADQATAQTHSLSDNLIRLLDTGNIQAVAAAMQEHGYKAEIKKNEKGESYIASGANGSDFQVYFYGCKDGTACTSYDIYSWYKKDPLFTVDLVNEWNSSKRFLVISLDKDGTLSEYMYGSAVGQTTYANFFDQIDWFTSMDGTLGAFLKEKRDKLDKAKEKK